MQRPPADSNDRQDDRKKRWKFGQNFLVDESVIRQIAEDVPCGPADWVLEIGPGAGAITRRLLPRCQKLTAIEIDSKWVDHLRKHPEWGNMEVIQADATRIDVEDVILRSAPGPGSKPFVVGNLPYNRAAPILFRFLPFIHRFKAMNIMVQYEVGKRICAKPHSRDFGFLSVFIQNHATAEMLQKIPQDAFRPRPKVLSATIRLIPLAAPKTEDPMFLRFVELAFSQKRKKMSNSLLPFYPKDKVNAALQAIEVGENARAEDLSVDQFVSVFKTLGPPPGVLPRKANPPDISGLGIENGEGFEGEESEAELEAEDDDDDEER
jgi:16S rRNA (adenine1518-N6/adenine1519-N6)-dimethyltransferase